MRYVSTRRPRLAPIFRSDTQLQILGATYLEPERRITIPELVERSSRPQPTVAREVERLTEAGPKRSPNGVGGGEPGPQPQDIDVLVIGSANLTDVHTEAEIATGTPGRDVNVAVLTPAEWDRAASGFIEHVKSGPLVELDLRQ